MNEYRVGYEAISPLSHDDLAQAVYGVFDGVVAERDGRILVTVYVEGQNPVDAACHGIRKLEALGLSVVRLDLDLVDGPQIADRLDVKRQTVQNWARGTRGASFPRPIGSPGGKRIWAWSQVLEWARRERGVDEAPALSLDDVATVDAMLADRRRKAANQSVRVDWAIGQGTAKGLFGLAGQSDYLPSPVRTT